MKNTYRQPGHSNKLHGANRGQGPVQWASQKQQVPLVCIMMVMMMMLMDVRCHLHGLQVPFRLLVHLHLQSSYMYFRFDYGLRIPDKIDWI